MKHVVAITVVEIVVLALVGVTQLTGPHLEGTRAWVAWILAGSVVGFFGAPYPRRWWEERSRERSHSR